MFGDRTRQGRRLSVGEAVRLCPDASGRNQSGNEAPESQTNLNHYAFSVGSGESDNQDKICDANSAAAYELPPLSGLRVLTYKRPKTSDDENEMSDPAQRHHHGYKLLYAASVQR